ncbi:MAG: hypothetical protein JWM27_4774 [Gemmatimonadetes bacterium]|nr:hypothetical protein [Gemmatimonadota bacterium]
MAGIPGSVAWYVTGRFYATASGATQDLGYFLYLQGIDGSLFAGDPGEAAAYFTFRSTPFTATLVPNGAISIGLDPVGEFSVYLNAQPAGDFGKPDSFSGGTLVATFRRVGVVMGVTVKGPPVDDVPTRLFASNVFTSQLVSSAPFEFGGATYDFADLFPSGITQWGTAAEVPLPPVGEFATVLPFAGSAVIVG